MGNDSFGDFLRQVPIGLLIAPVAFLLLYVGLMVYIFQRASARRRARATGTVQAGRAKARPAAPLGSFLSGELPNQSQSEAEWRVPAALRSLPEPDLDSLSSMPLLSSPGSSVAVSDVTLDNALAMAFDSPATLTESTPTMESTSKSERAQTGLVDAPGDAIEVLRVWRDLGDGKLIVELGGHRYRSASEITNPELARRFSALVLELNAMIGVSGTPLPSASGAAAIPPPSNSVGGLRARVEAMDTLNLAMSNTPLDDQPNRPPGLLRSAPRKTSTQPSAPPPSRTGIADAVEEYLQFKLSNSDLRARSIHIRPAMDGGVRIEVDGYSYGAVDDVVDPDVREFIKTVLREWEARQ